jgi:hypothetical protein
MDYTLSALNEAALELGKGVVLYADKWTGLVDLTLSHLGDTEGPVVFEANEQIGNLTLPEVYGPGAVKAWVVGAEPTLTAPLFLATPALRDLINPTGTKTIGLPGRRPVKEYTLAVLPQALWYNSVTGQNNAKVQYLTATGWRKSAVAAGDPDSFQALAGDDLRLLGLSIWIWAGYWSRPAVTYEATVENVVKNIEEATFTAMPNSAVLGGAMVTLGNPATLGIVIDVP